MVGNAHLPFPLKPTCRGTGHSGGFTPCPQLEEHAYYRVLGPVTPLSATVASKDIRFGFPQVLHTGAKLEGFWGSRVTRERRGPDAEGTREGRAIGPLAPQAGRRLSASVRGRLPPGGSGLGEALLRAVTGVFFTVHFQVAPFDTLVGPFLGYLQSRETPAEFSLEKF